MTKKQSIRYKIKLIDIDNDRDIIPEWLAPWVLTRGEKIYVGHGKNMGSWVVDYAVGDGLQMAASVFCKRLNND